MFPLLRLAVGPCLALGIWSYPFDLGSEAPEAHRLAGLTVWVIAWWVTEALPLAVTSLFCACFLVILDIAAPKAAFMGFSHPLVFLFLGGFILAKAMSVHGLDRRISLFILTRSIVVGNPWRTIAALILTSAGLSMWISNTATTAMLLPVGLGILWKIFPQKSDAHSRARGLVLLGVAYASSIGGLTTPVGSTPNIIALAMLEEVLSIEIGFFKWMMIATPIAIVCLIFLLVLIRSRLPKMEGKMNPSELRSEYRKLGKLSAEERVTSIAVVLAVFLWVIPGACTIFLGSGNPATLFLKNHFPESIVPILASLLLFSPILKGKRVLSWKQASEIDWNSLLLFGGGLSLGTMIFETGLAKVLGQGIVGLTGGENYWFFVALCIGMGILFTETTSNTATASMLIPLVIATTTEIGVSPLPAVLGVALACTLAFMLPVATPPNAIVFGSGQIRVKQMISLGWRMNLFAFLAIWTGMFLMQRILTQ